MNLSSAQVLRYIHKAAVVAGAWRALFRADPTRNALVLVMAVAEGETKLGDARGWEGENNWGALHKRALSSAEHAILNAHGITAALGAEGLRRARELLHPGVNERLHLDTSPHGPYFVWFWAFATEVEGAKKFLGTLVGSRPAVRAILDVASPEALARAMYETRYYEGLHKGDPDANIRDYAKMIRSRADAISFALSAPLEAVAMPRPAVAVPATMTVPAASPPPVMAEPLSHVGVPIDARTTVDAPRRPYDAGGSTSDWSGAPAVPPAREVSRASFLPIAIVLGLCGLGLALLRKGSG